MHNARGWFLRRNFPFSFKNVWILLFAVCLLQGIDAQTRQNIQFLHSLLIHIYRCYQIHTLYFLQVFFCYVGAPLQAVGKYYFFHINVPHLLLIYGKTLLDTN